jgi:hypothetical protein
VQFLRAVTLFFLRASRLSSISPADSVKIHGPSRALSINSNTKQESIQMGNFKIAAMLTAVVLALTAFGTTSVLSVVARLFCLGSVVIFAVSSTVGLAARLRS